jgi:tetratricopeptide (TPR) repeat protein
MRPINRLWSLLASLILAPFAVGADAPKGIAVLIGADQYDKFNNLKYCGRDAADLGRLLRGEYGFRVTVLNQELAKTRPDLGPDARRVRDHLKTAIEECQPGDTLIISYSGHGQQEPNKAELELTFADSDTGDSFLKLTELYALMAKCKAKQKLLILDACRKETSRDRVEDLNSDPSKLGALMEVPAPPDDVMVVLSCVKGEVSLESPVFGHGLFSHFLLTEWRGRAAKGEVVAVGELLKACVEPTRSYAKTRTGTPQTPQVLAGKGAKVVLAPPGGKHLRKALDHFQARRFLEAEQELTLGLEDAESARLFAERANVRLRRGYPARAMEDAKEAVKLAPNFPPALLARADCRLERGECKESLADCNQAIKIDPSVSSAYLSRAAARFELGEFHEAHDDIAHALRLAPKDLDTLLWKIDSDDMLYDDDRSLSRARQVLKDHPEAIEAMMTASSLVENLGDRKEAERYLCEIVRVSTQRLKADPENLSLKVSRANANRKLRKFAEAEAEVRAVLNVDPKYGAAHRVRCEIHTDRNEHKQAVEAGTRTIACYPGFSTSYLYRARAHRSNFDSAAAMNDVEVGLKIAPNSPFLLWEKARLLESQREFDKSQLEYSRVVSLYPAMWYAYVARARGAISASDPERATTDLLRAVELAPNNPLAISELGDHYHSLGRLDEAQAMYSRALKASPTSTYAYISRGWVFYAQKEYAKATADFQKAVAADPDNPDIHSPLGMSLFQEHRYAEAIAPLTRAIEGNSDSASVFLTRGRARLMTGDTEGMVEDFERAEKLTPPDREDHDSAFYYFLYLECLRVENTERIDRYVRSEPENVYYYYLRAQILKRLKKFDAALANADAILKIEPKAAVAHLVRARVYLDQKQKDKAIAAIEQGLTLAPESGNLLIELSDVYDKKEIDKAIEALDRCVKLDPKNKFAYRKRALARFSRDEFDGAIQDLTRYLELAPEDEGAYSIRGTTYRFRAAKAQKPDDKERDLDLAIADYSKAIALEGTRSRDYLDRGELYLARGKLKEAVEDFDALLKLDPMNDEGINFRGIAYFRQEQYPKALDDFARAVELSPAKAIFHENCGRALVKLKRFDEAVANLKKSLELEPDIDEAKKLLVEAIEGRLDGEQQNDKRLADLSELIRLAPETGKYYLHRARVRIERKEDKLAEQDLKKAIELSEIDPLPRATRAIFYLDRDRPKEALDDIIKLFASRPSYPGPESDAAELLAAAADYLGDSEYQEALRVLDLLIEKRPTVGAFYWYRAGAKHALKRGDEALADLAKAIELKYETAELLAEKAGIHSKRGEGKDFELALADAEKALRLDPMNAKAARERLHAAVKLNHLDRAIELADELLKAEPNDVSYLQYRGMAYLEKKDFAAARKDFRRIVEIDSHLEKGHFWLGSLLRAEKKYPEAIESLDDAIELNGDDAPSYTERGRVYRELKQLDKAEQDFLRALALSPKSATPLLELARASVARKNFGTALDRVEEAVKKKPELAEGYELRAEIYRLLGEVEKAKADRAKAESLKGKK